jgi:type I restriction enzyme S subunit
MPDALDLGPIPIDWNVRQLSNVCSIKSGGTPPKHVLTLWSGDIPWVSGKDLKSHRLRDSIDHITRDAAETFSKIAPAGSVLVLVRGMGLANGFGLSLIERPMAFNQDLKALIPNTDVSGTFLMYALTFAGQRMLRNVTNAAHGTKRLSQDDLDGFELPIPPLAEQLAIARVLDLARTALDIERRSLERTEALKRAAMRDLFTRGLRGEAQKESEIGLVPETWEVIPLGSLGRVGNGSTPKKASSAYWNGGSYPWLTSAKVYDREIVTADQFVTNVALDECHLPRIKPGAVLVAITGQGKTLGHCAVLRIEATINQHIAYIAIDTGRADASFVRGYLETKYEHLRQVASGGGSTKGALTCAFLRSLPIPFTPIGEQREIVDILDAIDKKIDLHKRKRAVLEELFQSLLRKLMTGEIRVSNLSLSTLEVPAADAVSG